MPTRIVAPSLLSADFAHLGAAVQMLNESQAEWIHLDVMDGVFVPNISFGFPIIKAVRALTQKVLDAHLMIVEPDKYLARFAEVGVQYLTVHYEVCPHLHRTLSEIRRLGMKAGVAINPHTPPEVLEYSLQEADLVLECRVLYSAPFAPERFKDDIPRKFYSNFEPGLHTLYIGAVERAMRRE